MVGDQVLRHAGGRTAVLLVWDFRDWSLGQVSLRTGEADQAFSLAGRRSTRAECYCRHSPGIGTSTQRIYRA